MDNNAWFTHILDNCEWSPTEEVENEKTPCSNELKRDINAPCCSHTEKSTEQITEISESESDNTQSQAQAQSSSRNRKRKSSSVSTTMHSASKISRAVAKNDEEDGSIGCPQDYALVQVSRRHTTGTISNQEEVIDLDDYEFLEDDPDCVTAVVEQHEATTRGTNSRLSDSNLSVSCGSATNELHADRQHQALVAGANQLVALEEELLRRCKPVKDSRVIDLLVSRVVPDLFFVLVEIIHHNRMKYKTTNELVTMTYDTKLLLVNAGGDVKQSIIIPNVCGEYQTKRLVLDYEWSSLEDKKQRTLTTIIQHRILVMQTNEGEEYEHNKEHAARICSWLLESNVRQNGLTEPLFKPEKEREINVKSTEHFLCVDLYSDEPRSQICLTDAQGKLDRSVTFSGIHLGRYSSVLRVDSKSDGSEWIVCGFKHYLYEFMLHGHFYRQRARIHTHVVYHASQFGEKNVLIRGLAYAPSASSAAEDTCKKLIFLSTVHTVTKQRAVHILRVNEQARFEVLREVGNILPIDVFPEVLSSQFEPFWQPDLLVVDKQRTHMYVFHTVLREDERQQIRQEIRLDRYGITGSLDLIHESSATEDHFLQPAQITGTTLQGMRIPFVKGVFEEEHHSLLFWRSGTLTLTKFQL